MRSILLAVMVCCMWSMGCEKRTVDNPPPVPSTSTSKPSTAAAAASLTYDHGGIVRGPRDRKCIALIFTGGSYGEGAPVILNTLKSHGTKASFFVTGDFIRAVAHRSYLLRMIAEGHYLGPHSNSHLLYCSWEDRSKTLVTEAQFRVDLEENLKALVELGVPRAQMRFFVPPYEWYNEEIARWARRLGLVLINFSPGTRSTADYIPEADRRYVASEGIFRSIVERESDRPDGLNGFLLLFHIGVGSQRTDKMYDQLGRLLGRLTEGGYRFVRIDELLNSVNTEDTPRDGRLGSKPGLGSE